MPDQNKREGRHKGRVLLKIETTGMSAEFFEDGSMRVHGDDGYEAKSMEFAKACWQLWTTAMEMEART